MSKGGLFPVLLLAGCLIAGLYGALHNQISYSVSPDYFHALKFDQFDISPSLRNRFGASLVGWQATWWMGLFVGLPLLLVGLIMPNGKSYLIHSLIAFAVVMITALFVGLGELARATEIITEETLPTYNYRAGVSDPVAYARAGAMHNASYRGGFLGIITGSAYLIAVRITMVLWRYYKSNEGRLNTGRTPGIWRSL